MRQSLAVQMSQFWRPSAWADHLHAYNTWDHMLLGPCVLWIPSHVFIDPWRLCFMGVAAFSLGFGSGYAVVTAVTGLACMIFNMSSRDIEAALKRNTMLNDPNISTNMPSLIHHLRQLAAAYGIIERHALQGSPQPAKNSSLSTSSSLTLMHAAESCRLFQ